MAKLTDQDEKDIAWAMQGGLTRRAAKAIIAKRKREELAAVHEAHDAVNSALNECGLAVVHIGAMLEAAKSATGYTTHGAAKIITRVFRALKHGDWRADSNPDCRTFHDKRTKNPDHWDHFKANVSAASRALDKALAALITPPGSIRQVGDSVEALNDAAYYLGRAEVHRSYILGKPDPEVDGRFEELLLSRRQWGGNLADWLRNR